MFCEIPVFGRCCFCMPLRRGILTFGYLNLQILVYLRVFYYYTLCTLAATILLEIVVSTQRHFITELLPIYFAGLCLNIYLIFLVRSLVRKLERSGHTYENQLHQIVNGEVVKDPNSVYPSTVVPVETA